MSANYDYLLSLLLRFYRRRSPDSHHQPGVVAHWLESFTVFRLRRHRHSRRNLGAKSYMPPTDFEDVGRISIPANPPPFYVGIFKAAARSASVA